MTVLAFDTETRLLASEVAEQYAAELDGADPWNRADLFGFAAGVVVDTYSGAARYYSPGQAAEMITALEKAEATVGFNSAGFDLPVLSSHGDVSAIHQRHLDLRLEVKQALRASPEATASGKKLYAGGLDDLARANGLGGKSGGGVDAPALYRKGLIPDLLRYCEADVRLTAALYCLMGEGLLQVEPSYYSESGERKQLGRCITLSPQPR